MAPPTPLAIATGSVSRLVKEKWIYHEEMSKQEARIQKSREDMINKNEAVNEDNTEFVLKQEQAALEETKAIFGPLHARIAEAVLKLEEKIAFAESDGTATTDELKKAKDALEKGINITNE